jgi:phosphomannomutase
MTPEQAILAAHSWISADPDDETRRELQEYVDDPGKRGLLLEVMSGSLQFGTAGLRAIVGPGPMRMNRAVVRRTTAGVARYLLQQYGGTTLPPIVVGADARLSSQAFRREVVGVLAAHGLPVRFFPSPVATPIAAYVARRLQASACIVITASHNPAEYNGYKLYGADAVQIVPPLDQQIAREIERSAPAARERVIVDAELGGAPGVEQVAEALLEDYYRDVARLRPPGAPGRDITLVYTPMHGVGAAPVERVLSEAGFEFPNPEEPGALDLATALARRVNADLILANDPDVDRLAASFPDGDGGWVPLTGNQIGILLAEFALERAAGASRLEPAEEGGGARPPAMTSTTGDGQLRLRVSPAASRRPLVLQSIVSSPMLRSVAQAFDAHFEQTLTGFKWIWTAALELMKDGELEYVFGYEEALGYSAGQLVRDKDGISAALLLAELAALERGRNRTLRQRLAELYRRYGLWVSVQRSVTRHGLKGAEEIRAAMDRASNAPPSRVLGAAVTRVTDYRTGGERRPRWLENTTLLELQLGELGRLLVRPSGTEPKLKIYVDLMRPVEHDDVWRKEAALRAEASALADALVAELFPS